MKILTPSDSKYRAAQAHFDESIRVAMKATCLRAKGGSIIVSGGAIIGRGFNSPPADDESQRRCLCDKLEYDLKITDKTCCIHAEQRAIIDALKNSPEKLTNSRLYYIRLNKSNEVIPASDPYCTQCSKLALDVGISEFTLFHEEGICIYDTREYNDISFKFSKSSGRNSAL